MKMIGKRGFSRIVEILLLILLAFVPLVMVSLPWAIPYFSGKVPGHAPNFYYEKYLVILLISGVMAELILWQVRGIMRNVNTARAFSQDTVRRLRVTGIECLVLGGLWGVSLVLVSKVFVAAVLVTFVVVGMILLVLAELFRQAVAYKEENEMTI